jgi:dihydropteroate synthase
MVSEAAYDDLLAEVREFLEQQAAAALEAGAQSVIVDPGLGFAKTAEHNLTILNHLDVFTSLGLPLLVGPSRKSFIGHLTGRPAKDRVAGTVAAVTASVLGGADVVRVHDVGVCKQAVLVADAIRRA